MLLNSRGFLSMSEPDNKASVSQQKRLTLSFLYANVGEAVLKQLGEEDSYIHVFPGDVAEKIRAKKEDYAAHSEFMAQVVTPVMDAFLDKACPAATSKPQVAQWVCRQY